MVRKVSFIALAVIMIAALISTNFHSVSAQGKADDQPEACDPQVPNPVALRIAKALDVSVQEIMGWHCKKYGFGEIRKAYVLARLTSASAGKLPALTVDKIFAMRTDGQGWGQIVKSAGLSMRELNQAIKQLMKAEKKGNAGKANHGKGKKGKGDNGDDDNGKNGKKNQGGQDDDRENDDD
jgi:hypothetical protein